MRRTRGESGFAVNVFRLFRAIAVQREPFLRLQFATEGSTKTQMLCHIANNNDLAHPRGIWSAMFGMRTDVRDRRDTSLNGQRSAIEGRGFQCLHCAEDSRPRTNCGTRSERQPLVDESPAISFCVAAHISQIERVGGRQE